MTELVEYLVENLVLDGDFVIETREGERSTDIVIIVAKHDIGKVIGKQGRIAKAIRTLVKAASGKSAVRYNVVIEEQPEAPATEVSAQPKDVAQESAEPVDENKEN